MLKDGTELQLASLCVADAELGLASADDPAFAALQVKYADMLGEAPLGMPPDRGMELELETGDARTPRSRPVKRLSDGELAELRAQFIDLLDRGGIQHSTAGHAAAAVLARKPDGSWRIRFDYRGFNAITQPAVEQLPHIDALLDAESTARGGLGSSPSLVSPAAITGRGCGPRIGGRRAFGRSWASGSGARCLAVCRWRPRCSHAS